jgi:hypothetical protein
MPAEPGCRDCGKRFAGDLKYELCARCVNRRLVDREVRDVVEELLPDGKYEAGGHEYRHGSNRALVITIGGPKSGLWYDWTAAEGGDLLALIARCRGCSVGEALRWARQWLGQPERQRPPRPVPARRPQDKAETRKSAKEIWRAARPLSGDDLACQYLFEERAIDRERLAEANDGKLPASLRFHPRLWNKETRRHYPALVAVIVDREDLFAGVHRTWIIEGEGGRVTKAPLEEPKLTLGTYTFDYGKGCIRLSRPKWREATDEDTLALSEGIEDALTVAQVRPLWYVAAGVALGSLQTTWVPEVFSNIVLIRQNDTKIQPVNALDKVRERFKREGRRLQLFNPPRGFKDVNEVAMRFRRRHYSDGFGPQPLDA